MNINKNNNSFDQDKDQDSRLFTEFLVRVFAVYIIHNNCHQKDYVGQTSNASRRKEDHASDLARGDHHNGQLQTDYNDIIKNGLNPKDYLKFETLSERLVTGVLSEQQINELKWELRTDEQKFVEKLKKQNKPVYNVGTDERDYIKRYLSFLLENERTANNACLCEINGVIHSSIKKAAIALKLDVETVRRRLDRKSKKWKNWKRIPTIKKKKEKVEKKSRSSDSKGLPRGVKYKNQVFSSIRGCSRETGFSTSKIINACDDANNSEFWWIQDVDNVVSPKASSSIAQQVSIDGIAYRSRSQAGLKFKISKDTVKKRCESNDPTKWKTWFFLKME